MDNDGLEFQDISDKAGLLSENNENVRNEQQVSRSSNQENNTPAEDDDQGLNSSEATKGHSEQTHARFYELEFWQRYFDVDSREVAERLIRSFIPTRKHVFGDLVNSKPDFYGPFWSATTLIFLLGLSTNIRAYFLQPRSTNLTEVSVATKDKNYDFVFEYNFQLVPAALGIVCGYFILIGILEILVMKCLHVSIRCGLATLVCAHGYALAAFNLVAVSWLLNTAWVAWLVTTVCAVMSATSLIRTLISVLEPAAQPQTQTQTQSGSSSQSQRQEAESETQIVINVNLNDDQNETTTTQSSHVAEQLRRFAVPFTTTVVFMIHIALALSFMFVFYY